MDNAPARRNIVSITPAGSRHLAKLDLLLAGAQDELLAPLSAADRRRLLDLLGRLIPEETPPHPRTDDESGR